MFGIGITPGGIVGLLHRAAQAALPTYQALVAGVRNSGVVCPDETGWRVGGRGAWLWVFVGEDVTVYLIAPGRGYAQASGVLGGDFAGVIVRDGWVSYMKFALATHQTCLAHLLRRCHEMVEAAPTPEAAALPGRVKGLLKDALALRDDAARGLDTDAYLVGIESLVRRRDELLRQTPEDPGGRRPLQLSHPAGRGGHQPPGRASHPPRRGESQVLGRQPHLAGGRHPADPCQRSAHRSPAGSGPG